MLGAAAEHLTDFTCCGAPSITSQMGSAPAKRSATAPSTLNEMNPRLAGTLDRVYYYAGTLVWIYCLASIAARWLGKF